MPQSPRFEHGPPTLNGNSNGVHHPRSAIDLQLRPSNITTESTRQESHRPTYLLWPPCSLQTNRSLLALLSLQCSGRKLALCHLFDTTVLQIDADINLPSRNSIDPHTGSLEHEHTRAYNTKCSMRSHCKSRSPTPTIRARNAGDDDNTSIRNVLWCSIRITPLGRCLLHCSGRILEREESRHGICIKCCVQVFRPRLVDGRGS
jgi:hypothetical protein